MQGHARAKSHNCISSGQLQTLDRMWLTLYCSPRQHVGQCTSHGPNPSFTLLPYLAVVHQRGCICCTGATYEGGPPAKVQGCLEKCVELCPRAAHTLVLPCPAGHCCQEGALPRHTGPQPAAHSLPPCHPHPAMQSTLTRLTGTSALGTSQAQCAVGLLTVHVLHRLTEYHIEYSLFEYTDSTGASPEL